MVIVAEMADAAEVIGHVAGSIPVSSHHQCWCNAELRSAEAATGALVALEAPENTQPKSVQSNNAKSRERIRPPAD